MDSAKHRATQWCRADSMEARTPRLHRIVWISVSAAVGFIFFYYYSSRSPVDSLPEPVGGPVAESGVLSLSGRSAMIAPAPAVGRDPARQAAASTPKLAVNGVMITPASRAALISVDGRPPTLFAEGEQIVDGVVLYALDPGGIVVKRGDGLLRLPLRGVPSAGGADAVQSAGSADPGQFVRSPDPVQSAESAGAELPPWAKESVLTNPPTAAEARRASRHHD